MNLHKFRQVKPSIKTPEVTNADYIAHLESLKEKKSHRANFTAIGTVAACLLVLVAVIIWSAIGKNVRDGDNIADIPPATEGQEVTEVAGSEIEYTVDEDAKQRFSVDIGVGHEIYQIPYFDKDNPPAIMDIATRMATLKTGVQYDMTINYIPGKKMNEYTKEWFGVEIADDDVNYGCFADMGCYMGPDLISMSSVQLSDGSTQYTATYGLGKDDTATLVYVGEMYNPTRFVSHKHNQRDFDGHLKDELYAQIQNMVGENDFVSEYLFSIELFWAREDGTITFNIDLAALFNDGKAHSLMGSKPEVSPLWQFYIYMRDMSATVTDDGIVINVENHGFNSEYYTDEEIADAMEVALAEYQKMMGDCDYKLYDINYDGCDALIESHKDFATRNNADEVIVINSNFRTSDPAPSGMDEFHDYTGYKWILVRNKGENWRLADCGY